MTMNNSRPTKEYGRLSDQENRSLTPIISVSSRKPSPETVPRPANFARPFNRQYNYPQPSQIPVVDRQASVASNGNSRSLTLDTHAQTDRPQAPFTPKISTLQRTSRPSQLKITPYLPSVNEVSSTTDSGHEPPEQVFDSNLLDGPGPVIRNASFGQKSKPIFKTVRRNDSSRSKTMRESETLPASDKERTIQALSAAIAAGFSASPTTPTRPNMSRPGDSSETRMPFPDSPTSVYTHDSFRVAHTVRDDHDVVGVNRMTKHSSSQEMLGPYAPSPLPERAVSSTSTNRLLGLGVEQPNVSSPLEHGRLSTDKNVSGEADTRQSITSLPELIRRATRLASNLDRGKTASRLGLEDLLGYNTKRFHRYRDSTYSDVLVSFPAPGTSTPPISRQRHQAAWTGNEKTSNPSASRSRGHKSTERPERRCCGLSLKAFLIVMIVVVILIAAAILVPIFLILVPQENKSSTDLQHCPTSHPCQNGGVSVVDNNACSCICVDGFTGNQCGTVADPDCITADVRQGSTTYNNATLGGDILPVLSQSQSLFSIPLNISVLLSVFATNNISCSGENSLVHFNALKTRRMRTRQRRSIVLSGLGPEAPVLSALPVPTHTEINMRPKRTAVLAPRDSIVTSTSNDNPVPSATSSVSSTNTATASTTISSYSSTSTTMTNQQAAFAEVVVLYVLGQSRTPSIAVNAQQLMKTYFLKGGPSSGNTTVEVVTGTDNKVVANFAQFTISLCNGTTVGQISST